MDLKFKPAISAKVYPLPHRMWSLRIQTASLVPFSCSSITPTLCSSCQTTCIWRCVFFSYCLLVELGTNVHVANLVEKEFRRDIALQSLLFCFWLQGLMAEELSLQQMHSTSWKSSNNPRLDSAKRSFDGSSIIEKRARYGEKWHAGSGINNGAPCTIVPDHIYDPMVLEKVRL